MPRGTLTCTTVVTHHFVHCRTEETIGLASRLVSLPESSPSCSTLASNMKLEQARGNCRYVTCVKRIVCYFSCYALNGGARRPNGKVDDENKRVEGCRVSQTDFHRSEPDFGVAGPSFSCLGLPSRVLCVPRFAAVEDFVLHCLSIDLFLAYLSRSTCPRAACKVQVWEFFSRRPSSAPSFSIIGS